MFISVLVFKCVFNFNDFLSVILQSLLGQRIDGRYYLCYGCSWLREQFLLGFNEYRWTTVLPLLEFLFLYTKDRSRFIGRVDLRGFYWQKMSELRFIVFIALLGAFISQQNILPQDYTNQFIEKGRTMTLVYRAPKLQEQKVEDIPGPGTYSVTSQQTMIQPSACFKSTLERQLKIVHNNDVRVGPGSYAPGEKYIRNSQGSAVFQSKIQRFQKEKHVPQQSRIRLGSECPDEVGDKQHKKIPGKIISQKYRKHFEKELTLPQRLPSIPNNQHSYGYRLDPATNKLIYNDSPKIMFSKRLDHENEDFYFQRIQSNLNKKQVCSFKSKVQRSSPELKHQIQVPNATYYHPQLYNSICSKQQQSHVKLESQFSYPQKDSNISKKDKLLLGQLKNQFKEYIKEDMDLQKLQNQKKKQLQERVSPCKRREDKNQFFLSKEKRFQQIKQNSNSKVISNNSSIKIDHSSIIKTMSYEEHDEKKRKQPFALGEPRFKEKGKENLGPGSYNYDSHSQNGASLLRNQQRFKDSEVQATPGPGAYNTELPPKQQKQKVPFNRFVCRKSSQQNQNKFSSMIDLYQQVGRHMNFLQKIEKETNRGQHSSQETLRKDQHSKITSLQMTKTKIREKIGGIQQKSAPEPKQVLRLGPNKPKYTHLYDYNRPQRQVIQTGPGCYEIRTTLEKKSFNKLPPPQYI